MKQAILPRVHEYQTATPHVQASNPQEGRTSRGGANRPDTPSPLGRPQRRQGALKSLASPLFVKPCSAA